MSFPANIWTNFLAMSEVLDLTDLFETRMDNDSSGKILYVGMSQTANADPALPIWFILKLSYDGNGFMNRKQLPDSGGGFLYSWDNRATYFS